MGVHLVGFTTDEGDASPVGGDCQRLDLRIRLDSKSADGDGFRRSKIEDEAGRAVEAGRGPPDGQRRSPTTAVASTPTILQGTTACRERGLPSLAPACTGWPAVSQETVPGDRRASENAWTVANRSAGSFASAFLRAASTGGGTRSLDSLTLGAA